MFDSEVLTKDLERGWSTLFSEINVIRLPCLLFGAGTEENNKKKWPDSI
jgi:hypothetical protein